MQGHLAHVLTGVFVCAFVLPASAGPDAPLKLRQGLLRRYAATVKIIDEHTIVCRAPRIWRALSEASFNGSSRLLRSSWVFNVSISLNGGHDVTSVNGSYPGNFKCADTPLQYGLSMRDSDAANYRSITLCGHFRYVPMWQIEYLVSRERGGREGTKELDTAQARANRFVSCFSADGSNLVRLPRVVQWWIQE